MNRQQLTRLIREHIETALWLADNLPTNPGQIMLRDTLVGALQEIEVLYPLAQARAEASK